MLLRFITTTLIVVNAVLDVDASNAGVVSRQALARRLTEDDHLFKLANKLSSRHSKTRILRTVERNNDDIDGEEYYCDAAFMSCLMNDLCVDCFLEMQLGDIDWASVTKDTPCDMVLNFVYARGHCTAQKGNSDAEKMFCSTFKACVTIDENTDFDDDVVDGNDSGKKKIDCDALTSCEWEGMHYGFVGDGVCHDFLDGCYNTEICGYDGGDCCEDTCSSSSAYMGCGHEGYTCKDPNSKKCNPNLTNKCKDTDYKADDDDGVHPSSVECEEGTAKFRLIMYDSFGDGWDDTRIKIQNADRENGLVFNGGLAKGSQGTEYICLSLEPACYRVDVTGGIWGNEVSFEIKPLTEGSPSIAGGGAPSMCNFSVGGKCENTCFGKPNKDRSKDPDYKQYKDMFNCISSKCPIQVGVCENDSSCAKCLGENPDEFCFGIDLFSAVIDCSLCKCSSYTDDKFCQDKLSPGQDNGKKKDEPKKTCSPTETLQGSQSVMAFGKCTDFDQVGMMLTEFDNENFGDLDKFEACSHGFKKDSQQSGHTALGCMQILVNAMNTATDDDKEHKKGEPTEAIAELAYMLYHDAERFCDCAKNATDTCPLCQSFVNFKTLLYESLDACQSLDEIDCDAWNEFQKPCKTNLMAQFGAVDFTKKEQCDYVHRTCGGVGPFPSFRRLDCYKELPQTAWDMYNDFSKNCLGDDVPKPYSPPKPTPPAPAPQPPAPAPPVPTPSKPTTPQPTPTPYEPKPSSEGKKPYVPPEDRGKKGSSSDYVPSDSEGKKKSHRFRHFVFWCILLGGIYYAYQKYGTEGFQFVRYRRGRRNLYSGDEDGIYSGLTMESSTTFEPPSLPPPPSFMSGGVGN